jgi:ABC-type lipoprotein release transport system permease subunit
VPLHREGGPPLDPEVYYIPSLPVKIEPLQTALTVLIAILVTYLASIYPRCGPRASSRWKG